MPQLYPPARALQPDPSGGLKRRIIDQITTGETLFFRDTSPFDLLRHKIVPELIDRRARSGLRPSPIRVWSAACSSGQEIYSIAMVFKELLGDLSKYNIQLIGTDISDQAVARASAGIYSDIEMARGLTDAALRQICLPRTPAAGRSATNSAPSPPSAA